MDVTNRVSIETNAIRLLREHLNSRFVIEDHLRFLRRLSFGSLATFDEALGLEQGIGVPFQAAGIPGKIDQQTMQELTHISARREFLKTHLS